MVTQALGSGVWLPRLENAALNGRRWQGGPGSHQRALFLPLLNHRGTLRIASLCICTVAACPASGRLWHPSGVATRLASFPPPSLKPGLTGVLCSHSKGSIESSQMRAGVGSCPAGVAQPTKCQRALPATEPWSPSLPARARRAGTAPANTLWKD